MTTVEDAARLARYRSLLEIRGVEQRAHDRFLQNLVKGTSHLALGPTRPDEARRGPTGLP